MDLSLIRQRAVITQKIRQFFTGNGFLEVETPLLSPHLIPESSIENFKCDLISPYGPSRPLYLTPSPEVWMKALLAGGSGDIFQICKSFRNSEQISPIHNPEFTMLEWYRTGITADENIRITEALVRTLADRETPENVKAPFRIWTMEDAFCELAGFSLSENLSSEALRMKNREHDIPVDREDDWEVLFHKLFLTLVEPELPTDAPLVLKNYPSALKTLAADIPGTPWSDRWELYMNGVEVANCYTEETDPEKVRLYYSTECREKNLKARIPVQTDPDYPDLFKTFPSCSGTAVGVDRLIAQILGKRDIQGVILFPLSDILA